MARNIARKIYDVKLKHTDGIMLDSYFVTMGTMKGSTAVKKIKAWLKGTRYEAVSVKYMGSATRI